MTNDEFQMTKEIQMTNGQNSKGLFRRLSSFVLRLPSRSHAKAGHSSFVIFTRFALAVLIVLTVSCSGKRITKANVDQVTEGMSRKQVESVLGPPTSRRTDVYVYRQGKDQVTVLFKDDKVQSKKSTFSD